MSASVEWMDIKYEEIFEQELRGLTRRRETDPRCTVEDIEGTLQHLYIMDGAGWYGRGGVQDITMAATIAAYEHFITEWKSERNTSMEWRASHILVKDRSRAEDILKRIKQGASFESMAREFSTCPSKSSGGDLGWFGPGKMVAPFESAVKRLSPGSVGDVVQTQFGYHIIKCTGRKD